MQRPTGVTVISVLGFIGSGLLLLAALGMFLGGAILSSLAARPGIGMMAGIGGVIVGVVFICIAAVYLVLGIGLWKLQEWARILTLVFIGLGIILNAFSILQSVMHFHIFRFFFQAVFIAVDIWIIVYLLQPNVRQAFNPASA